MHRPAGEPVTIVRPDSPQTWDAARRLVLEYAESLGIDLAFQDFDREIRNLAMEYGRPLAVFLLARRMGEFAGCGAVRRLSTDVCEMKRLYVAPRHRSCGLGRLLATRLVAEARAMGYRSIRLDTLPQMHSAQGLYKSLGFREVPSYRFNPVPGATFLQLDL